MNGLDSGAVLALAVILLGTRHVATALVLVIAQGAALAVTAAVGGHPLEAACILLTSGIGLPWLVHTSKPPTMQPPMRPPVRAPVRPLVALAAGTALAVLATPISLPLAVVLSGIFLLMLHQGDCMRLLGLLVMQNGIALAGLGLPGPERIATLIPVIPVLAWLAQRRAA